MLEADRVTVAYGQGGPALHEVSLQLPDGASVGLAGPSGCGKSTLARVLALVQRPDSGEVRVDGELVTGWRHRAPRRLRTRVGVVLQQPRMAVDPRMRLADVIAEPLRAGGHRHAAGAGAAAERLALTVGLTGDLLRRQPHEVSDGQLQRACLARALVRRPSHLICDEMTSMLDASTTAALVGAVEEYRHETGAALLAISHDEMLLQHWCDTIRHLPSGDRDA